MGWPERIRRLYAESRGFLDMLIVAPSDLSALIDLAHAGDAAADRIANATSEMMTIVRRGSRRTPTLCTGCSKPLRAGRAGLRFLRVGEFRGAAICCPRAFAELCRMTSPPGMPSF